MSKTKMREGWECDDKGQIMLQGVKRWNMGVLNADCGSLIAMAIESDLSNNDRYPHGVERRFQFVFASVEDVKKFVGDLAKVIAVASVRKLDR